MYRVPVFGGVYMNPHVAQALAGIIVILILAVIMPPLIRLFNPPKKRQEERARRVVTSVGDAKCTACGQKAPMLIYDDGHCEIVCGQCGHSAPVH